MSRYFLFPALLLASAGALAQPGHAASGPSKAQLAKLCPDCAWVADVHTEERKGQASGLGMVGGAVVGGLLGNQVGGGSGKKIATVGGAVAGGYAGNEIEKSTKSHKVWVVKLVGKDGRSRKHEQAQDPKLKAGDTVQLRDGQLQRR